MFAPVAVGVDRLEGSSEVKMVAEDGEMRYFDESRAMRDSLKPNTYLASACFSDQ